MVTQQPARRATTGDSGAAERTQFDRRWSATYDELRAWVTSIGRWPSRSSPGSVAERRLGDWVAFQRRRHAAGVLAAERLRLLLAIPGWRPSGESHWHESYDALRLWVDDHGRFPSRTAGDPTERRLGRWIDTQRRVRRRGDDDPNAAMPPARARLLEAIPGWQWSPRAQSWRESYDKLAAWVATHGRMPSAVADDDSERHLAHWAGFQRELHRRRGDGGVDDAGDDGRDERRALLEAIPGWRPLPPRRPHDESWSATCAELAGWVSGHRRFPSNASRDRDERRLARWVTHQRAGKRRRDADGAGPMTLSRQARLEAIPGWDWSPPVGRRR